MATQMAYPEDGPRRLLAGTRELARRARQAQRATWFPLLLFGTLTFASLLVRRYSGHHLDCGTAGNREACRVYSEADFVYWPAALVLAYAAIVVFYLRRSWARGVGTRVRPYAIAGIVIAVVMTTVAFWQLRHPLAATKLLEQNGLLDRLASPGTAIGLALLVLVWAERNLPLLAFTAVYLAVVIVPIAFGATRFDPPWYALPAFAHGTVLLLGGIGFAATQRPLQSPAP